MAAAEKFKAPDVSTVSGAVPTTVPQPIPEESDEEVISYFIIITLKTSKCSVISLSFILISVVFCPLMANDYSNLLTGELLSSWLFLLLRLEVFFAYINPGCQCDKAEKMLL